MTDQITSDTLRVIGDNEEFSSEWSLREDGITVDAKFSVAAFKGGPRYEKRCVVSFKDVTHEELIDLARYEVVVGLQRRLRDSKEGMLRPSLYSSVSVKDDIINSSGARGPVDKKARALRDLEALGLSEADLAELRSKLGSQNS